MGSQTSISGNLSPDRGNDAHWIQTLEDSSGVDYPRNRRTGGTSGGEYSDVPMPDASPTLSRRPNASGDLQRDSIAEINEHLPSYAITTSDIDTLRQKIR